MSEVLKCKVGDKVVLEYGLEMSLVAVEKVTKTQIFCANSIFDKEGTELAECAKGFGRAKIHLYQGDWKIKYDEHKEFWDKFELWEQIKDTETPHHLSIKELAQILAMVDVSLKD